MTRTRALFAMAAFAGGLVASLSAASAQGVELFAVLLGGNEVKSPSAGNPDGGVRAGDLDGYGTGSIIFVGRDGICFTLAVSGIDTPIAAHLHRGTAGLNGGVVITLAPPVPPGGGNPGVASGCLSGLSAALLSAIRATPSNFYINVHTDKFSDGALRGQLF